MSAAGTATIVIYETTATPPRPSSPYTNSNPGSDWSALTIASILVTVLGFTAVLAVVFWIFRKEKLAREEERREANASFWPGFRGWNSGNRQGPRKDIARADVELELGSKGGNTGIQDGAWKEAWETGCGHGRLKRGVSRWTELKALNVSFQTL
ncbi:hypothetical protein IFR05_003026 [Cadophora sp. M221]|nr:hypothetical protein IFR05_003026 [Cadophora sp. M221]